MNGWYVVVRWHDANGRVVEAGFAVIGYDEEFAKKASISFVNRREEVLNAAVTHIKPIKILNQWTHNLHRRGCCVGQLCKAVC